MQVRLTRAAGVASLAHLDSGGDLLVWHDLVLALAEVKVAGDGAVVMFQYDPVAALRGRIGVVSEVLVEIVDREFHRPAGRRKDRLAVGEEAAIVRARAGVRTVRVLDAVAGEGLAVP